MFGSKSLCMGKNTWESISNKPLKERDNLILSKTLNIEENTPKNNYIKSFNTIDKLENVCKNQKYNEICIIGGSQIYTVFIDLLTIFCILILLIFINPQASIFAIVFMVLASLIYLSFTKTKIKRLAIQRQYHDEIS